MSAYAGLIHPDHYPSFFIYLTVDPAAIDINIHPTKTEIKFEDESAIWQIINAATREAIGKFSVAPSIDFDTQGKIDIPVYREADEFTAPEIDVNPAFNPFNQPEVRAAAPGSPASYGGYSKKSVPSGWQKLYDGFPKTENHPFETFRSPSFIADDEPAPEQHAITISESIEQPFFQLKGRYILTPVKSGMMVIDQVKAHQRILFEYYLSVIEHHTGIVQQELFPQLVELNPADYAMLLGIASELQLIGWDIRPATEGAVAIYGSPATLSNQNFKEVLEGLLQELKNDEMNLQDSTKIRIARSMAIASSIKASQTLSTAEMQDLFDKLFACISPNTSPTDKPTLFILGLDELEKRFK